MALNINPILSEIQGLSPAAQAALGMAGHALAAPPAPAVGPGMGAGMPTMTAPAPPSVTQAPMHDPGIAGLHSPILTPQMKADALPKEYAGLAPVLSSAHMDSPTPQMNVPAPESPTGPILGTTQGDTLNRQEILGKGPGVDSIYRNITGSDFGQNHPVLGKILGVAGEVGGKIGDTISNAFPGIGREIPGTTQNYNQQLQRANTALTQDEASDEKQAQTANLGATTQHTQAETEGLPQEQSDKHDLSQSQQRNLDSETETRNAPAFTVHDTEEGPLLVGKDGTAQHLTVDGQPVGPKLKLTESQPIIGPDGKPHTYMIDEKGNKKVDLGVHYERPQTVVNTAEKEGQNFFVPDGQGGTKMIRVKPGEAVPAGAQSASGLNAVNTPTTQQRTAAGRAETVVAMAPEVLSRIDALAPKLGPIEGRWNEFMQGKVGADDPDFSALRSDLLMMSSAVALAHAQGRLPENLREEFDHAINSPKQTPENLKATINTMLPWLTQMQKQGQPNASQGTTPTRPAGVPANYQWNPQGNGGKGSWRAPQ